VKNSAKNKASYWKIPNVGGGWGGGNV